MMSEWTPLSRERQIVVVNCLDLYHKPPDSGELRYNPRTRKRRFDPALRAGGRGWADPHGVGVAEREHHRVGLGEPATRSLSGVIRKKSKKMTSLAPISGQGTLRLSINQHRIAPRVRLSFPSLGTDRV